MTTYLSIPGARILLLRGWGKTANPDRDEHRIELADPGEFTVYRSTMLREKRILSIPISQLRLGAYTKQITSGGGWRGGGFGIGSAMLGAAQAQLLNRLTTKTHEYTILGATAILPNGTERDAIFGFLNLDESDLRDKIQAALYPWAEGYVTAVLDHPDAGAPRQDLSSIHTEIDRMQTFALLDASQSRELCSRASEPFVAALQSRLQDGSITPQEAHRIKAQIDRLHKHARLTDRQAQQTYDQLAPILTPPTPPPPPKVPDAARRQIETLAALRSLGAMSQAQFEAERARLLRAQG